MKSSIIIVAALTLCCAAASAALAQQSVPATPLMPPGPPTAPAAPTAAPQPEQEKKPIYDEQADAREQIAAALAKAKKENRRVLIQWGGNWCGWCVKLHHLCTTDAEIKRKLLYEYDVVHVDAGRDNKNMDLAAEYEADVKKNGFPFLTVLDSAGKVVAHQETGSLEKKDEDDPKLGHDPELVLAFLDKHHAPYLEAQKILDKGLAEASSSGKRVFLHFGAPWCGWCHKLEDWMARDEVAKLLAKDFIDVKIDTERTIGGEDLHKTFNPQGGGIPWFVFLDSEGKSLITSTAPPTVAGKGGNTGFPYQPEEIAHFKTMLTKAAQNLSAKEIDALCESLDKNRIEQERQRQQQSPPAGH